MVDGQPQAICRCNSLTSAQWMWLAAISVTVSEAWKRVWCNVVRIPRNNTPSPPHSNWANSSQRKPRYRHLSIILSRRMRYVHATIPLTPTCVWRMPSTLQQTNMSATVSSRWQWPKTRIRTSRSVMCVGVWRPRSIRCLTTQATSHSVTVTPTNTPQVRQRSTRNATNGEAHSTTATRPSIRPGSLSAK